MLVRISNSPRDYAWGSTTAIAELTGRAPSGRPEAEVWFGDHPSDPADIVGGEGATLDHLTRASRRGTGRLPFLVKVLAASAPLSIQAHPTKAQARLGFAREEGAGVAVRNYVDDNHKPELLIALSDRFEALCGLRDPEASDRLLSVLGPSADTLRMTLRTGLADALAWLLGPAPEVREMIAALGRAQSAEFASELDTARRIRAAHPDDPGVIVALLMNLVKLRAGEAMFIGAGVLHAYLSGLGVEVMAASDNVLRGGLTQKHVDIDELLRVVDPSPMTDPRVEPQDASPGVERFAVPVDDFVVHRVRGEAELAVGAGAIAVSTRGAMTIDDGAGALELRPGEAVFVAGSAPSLRFTGDGEVIVTSIPRHRHAGAPA